MVERITQLAEKPISGQSLQGIPSSSVTKNNAAGEAVRGIANLFIAAQNDDQVERRAIRQSYNTARKLDIEGSVATIISESPNDGDRISNKIKSWESGYLESLPPEFRVEDSARIGKLANIGIAKANANLRVIEQERAEANDNLQQGNFLAEIKAVNRDYWNADPQISEAAREQAEVLDFDFRAQLTNDAVAPDGTIRISPKIAQERIQNYNDITQSARIMGKYERSRDKDLFYLQLLDGGDDIEILKEGVTGEGGISEKDVRVVREMDTLSESARSKLITRVELDLKADNDFDKKIALQETENLEETQDQTAVNNQAQISNPDPRKPLVTTEMIQDQLEANLITKETAISQIKEITKVEPPKSDPDYYNAVDAAIDDGRDANRLIQNGFINGTLTARDAATLREDNRVNLNADLSEVETAVKSIFSDAKTNINTGLTTNSIFDIMDEDEGGRKVRARQELRRRIDAARRQATLETDEDIQRFRDKVDAITNDVIKRNKFEAEGPTSKVVIPKTVPVISPKDITKQKLKDGYLELLKQRMAGDITQQEFNEQVRQIERARTLLNKEEPK